MGRPAPDMEEADGRRGERGSDEAPPVLRRRGRRGRGGAAGGAAECPGCDPNNPLLPQNEAERGKCVALLVAFAGFGALVSALVFSRMVTAIGQDELAGVPRGRRTAQ